MANSKISRKRSAVLMLRSAALVSLTIAGLMWWSGGRSSAATVDGAATTVVDNNAGKDPLLSGLSDTSFGVQLAPSAKAADGSVNNRPDCSADSATGGTFVYTYLIHQGEDVTKENFSGGEPGTLPDNSTTLALFDSQGNIQTNPTTFGNTQSAAPGTGQINLPGTESFQWGQLTKATGGGVPLTGPTGLLYQNNTSGVWKGGWACYKAPPPNPKPTDPSPVTDYWGFTVTFTATPPGPGNSQGFSWSLVPDGTPTSTTTTTPSTTTTSLPSATTVPSDPTLPASTVPGTPGPATTSGASLAAGAGASNGPGIGGGDPSALAAGSSSDGAQLPVTGAPLRPEANAAIMLAITGVLLLMLSIVIGERGRLASVTRSG